MAAEAEKAVGANLPPASGIPFADEETGQTIISFPWDGKTWHVKVRAETYGRQLETIRGTTLETYEEEDPETGEKRTIMRRDPYAEGQQVQALFDNWVLEVNGVPWTRGTMVASLRPGFVYAFQEVFAPKMNPSAGLDRARKKSKTR
jgi:hypothetical protein